MSAWEFSFFGNNVALARPWGLWLAVLSLCVAFLGIWQAVKRKKALAKLISAHRLELLTKGVSVARPVTQSTLLGLGLVLFSLAIAQPQCGAHSEWVKRTGIDVVVAIDASTSMYAEDVAPSRIARAKLELNSLLDELKGDRVAIVAFAQDAYVQCPLTTDYQAARMFLNAIEPSSMPQGGTNIGAALRVSKELLENADEGARNRVVVLLTDGEDLEKDIDDAARELSEMNVRVFAVGIGSEQGEPLPLFDESGQRVGFKKDAAGNTVISRLDSQSLKAIAERTDGRYFYKASGVATVDVAKAIDAMEKSEFESRLTVRYAEGFQYFLLPGLLLVSIAMAMSASRRSAS